MKKKILYIIDHFGYGGAQQQLIELLKHIDKDRFSVIVCSLSDCKNSLIAEIEKMGIGIKVIPHKGKFSFKTITGMCKLVNNINPDLINTYLFTSNLYGRLAAFLTKKPVVCSVRGYDEWKKPTYVFIDRIIKNFASHYIANANRVAKYLENIGVDKKNISIVYNGINVNGYSSNPVNNLYRDRFNIPSQYQIVGSLGRLDKVKDYYTFLNASNLVINRFKHVKFFIGGDGDLMDDLKKEVTRLGLNGNVFFLGRVKDVRAFFGAINVFVLSSLDEGCSNVIMEAMAMSKPVVATNVGGNPELVKDGVTGILVEKKNPTAMANAIMDLLRDSKKSEEMGTAGREAIESDFASNKMAEKTEKIYMNVK